MEETLWSSSEVVVVLLLFVSFSFPQLHIHQSVNHSRLLMCCCFFFHQRFRRFPDWLRSHHKIRQNSEEDRVVSSKQTNKHDTLLREERSIISHFRIDSPPLMNQSLPLLEFFPTRRLFSGLSPDKALNTGANLCLCPGVIGFNFFIAIPAESYISL